MVEVIFYLVVDGVLESRPGMLHLPLRPIYGIGDAACTLFLHRFTPEPITALGSKTDVGTFLFQELLISGLAGDVVANDSLRRCALAYFVDGRSSRNTSAKSFANC